MARSATYRRATVEIRRSATIGRAHTLPSSGSSQGSFSSCQPCSIQEAALRAPIIQRSIRLASPDLLRSGVFRACASTPHTHGNGNVQARHLTESFFVLSLTYFAVLDV